MAGDYTRFTHQPEKRYSGVLMQQGRVQLDSDSNEQVEILKRRLEVQAFDTFCGCAVPDTTLDGFKATVVTQGAQHDLTLGAGRMYVEGHLAEIFEGEAWTYLNQPFLPNPPALEPVAGAVPLVYLDVWDREVTWVQDRDLLEKALQGPDTATRIQTVWQVKIAVGACDTDLNSLFPPSAGRLSSRAVVPPAGEDPCIVSPTGGYRGLENRLYRVEIHDPGQAGDLSSARFKWSRDNASVVSPIESLDASREVLTVTRIGRDPVLRFAVGDWVELLDDHRELHGEAGQMAQVLAVDEANRTVTLDRAASADFDPGDPDRHTRLILWSQNAKNSTIDANGLIAASSPWIVLEDGVEIRLALDPAGGDFHVGDSWAFAARTVDGSVEELVEASPRGIIHHYCSLAELGTTAGAGLRVREDCRRIHQCGGRGEPTEPPGVAAGCCTVVEPGESIQAAIDGLPAAGGCVCLKAGTHPIEAPIRIDRSDVVLHGESLGARVVRSNGIRALSIEPVSDVAIRDLRFEVSGSSEDGNEIVSLLECSGVDIAGCQLLAMDPTGAPVPAIGISVVGSTSVEIRNNVMESLTAGVVGQDSFWIRVRNNHMTGLQSEDPSIVGLVGAASGDSADGPWKIEGNRIEHFLTGVEIGTDAAGSTVEGNTVRVAAGQSPEGGQIFGIDNAAIDTAIRGNAVEISDSGHGGIRTTASATRIEGNSVTSSTGAGDIGILIGGFEADGSPPADDCTIRDNSVQGIASAIATIGSLGNLPADGICVLENRIEPSASGDSGSAIFLLETRGAVVASNRIRGGSDGIAAQDSRELTVRDNTLEALSRYALFATTLAGIALVVDNSFSGVGPFSLVEVSGRDLEKITFSSNVCDHSLDGESPSTIFLEGSHQIVVGNQVQALSQTLPSFDFNHPEPLAVMSNLTTGELKNTGSSVPVNFTDFNARV